MALLPGHEGSLKSHEKAFLNDPMCQKEVFGTYVSWINLILQIVVEPNIFQHLETLPGYEGSFKRHKKAFLNDPNCQKEA